MKTISSPLTTEIAPPSPPEPLSSKVEASTVRSWALDAGAKRIAPPCPKTDALESKLLLEMSNSVLRMAAIAPPSSEVAVFELNDEPLISIGAEAV